jgi:hypothetical protein
MATIEESDPVMTAADFVEIYNENWRNILVAVERELAAGERSLSRTLRLVEAEWRKSDLRPTKGTSLGKEVVLPRAALFGARQTLRMSVLTGVCRPSTTLVVELGSGWGNNLLELYLSGAPRAAHYYALEPTESGRECTRLLAALEPSLKLTVLPFDYRKPNYSDIPRTNSHAVVFTSHSIETISQLNEDAITGLFGLGDTVTGVHFEPIGWQMTDHAGGLGSTKEYSLKSQYNENLWSLLSRLAEQGRISMDTVVPNIIHHKTYNASSLVIWHAPPKGVSK